MTLFTELQYRPNYTGSVIRRESYVGPYRSLSPVLWKWCFVAVGVSLFAGKCSGADRDLHLLSALVHLRATQISIMSELNGVCPTLNKPKDKKDALIGDWPGGPVAKAALSQRGPWVRSWVWELDSTCPTLQTTTNAHTSQLKIMSAAMKIEDPACFNQDPAQPKCQMNIFLTKGCSGKCSYWNSISTQGDGRAQESLSWLSIPVSICTPLCLSPGKRSYRRVQFTK